MANIQKRKFKSTNGDNLIVLPDTDGAANGDVLTVKDSGEIAWDTPQGGGGATGDYVPLTALDCKIGSNTSAVNVALAQGQNCYADMYSLAQGYYSSAYGNSLAVGYYNKAGGMQYYDAYKVEDTVYPAHTEYFGNSFTVGNCNSASFESLAVGNSNFAMSQSLALGINNYAVSWSTCVGENNSAVSTASVCFGSHNYTRAYSIACGYLCYALDNSQAFGDNVKAAAYSHAGNVIHGTFAIGTFNKTSAAPFVIGDGVGDSDRSDLFVIDASGNISAKGQLYVGVKTQGGTTTAMSTNELLTKLNALYALVAANSGSSNWHNA